VAKLKYKNTKYAYLTQTNDCLFTVNKMGSNTIFSKKIILSLPKQNSGYHGI